jgi:hypothetical protein
MALILKSDYACNLSKEGVVFADANIVSRL